MEKQKVINNYVLSIFTCGMLEVPIRNFRGEMRESVLISVRIQEPSQVWGMRQPQWGGGFIYAYREMKLVYLSQLLATWKIRVFFYLLLAFIIVFLTVGSISCSWWYAGLHSSLSYAFITPLNSNSISGQSLDQHAFIKHNLTESSISKWIF